MKNSAGLGGCYPLQPSASVDNILWDLQNSSYPTKAEFTNCFIIHSEFFPVLKVTVDLQGTNFVKKNPLQS